ncbi:DUF2971 domain-containing protein [Ferruginibacter sp.]|nr:DUF2971 domain-containing protein [Ferruginibacter sp.]
MKRGTLNISEPKAKSQFLWKYFDIHRFIYFLTEEKLFFTRLDKFEDPYEGVATKVLREQVKLNEQLHTSADLKKTKGRAAKYIKQVLIKTIETGIPNQIIEKQKRQYVNCWFSGDRESMAMWNLYSSPDSVAIKVKFTNIKNELNESFKQLIENNGNRISIIGDEITYLELNPFNPSLPKQNLKYSALKKDKPFEYENEYRFLIITIDRLDKVESFYTIPLDIEKLDLKIIAHPNMESWKYENINKLIELLNKNFKLEKSKTILRGKNYS